MKVCPRHRGHIYYLLHLTDRGDRWRRSSTYHCSCEGPWRPHRVRIIFQTFTINIFSSFCNSVKKSTTKSQPKSAAANNGVTANAGRGRGRTRRSRIGGRGKPKSAQELDAEMTDYFDDGANGATGGESNQAPVMNGATQPATATGGDTAMDDEILVSSRPS